MNKTILVLTLVAISGAAAAQSQIRLSDIPAGAIHTPGIGPGYIFPTHDSPSIASGETTMPATAMMPGTIPLSAQQMPAMGSSEAQVRARLQAQGFTNIQGLRQAPDGSWHGMAMQRGGMAAVSVDTEGVVSIRQ